MSRFSVGCQSIGVMRSSKLDEGLNFHLRMIVQPMKTAATEPAMTAITVIAVLPADEAAPVTTGVVDVLSGAAVTIPITVERLGGALLPFEGEEDGVSSCCCCCCCCCWVWGACVGAAVGALLAEEDVVAAEEELLELVEAAEELDDD